MLSIICNIININMMIRDMKLIVKSIFTNIPKKFLRRNLKHKKKSLKKLFHSSKRLKRKSTR